MVRREYIRRCELPVSAAEAFAWHARPGALQRLLPPWQNVKVLDSTGGIRDGDRVTLRLGAGPFGKRYVAEHQNYVEGDSFEDAGGLWPVFHWRHTHRFESIDGNASALKDQIEYALPSAITGLAVRELDRMFDFRHARTRGDLLAHARYKDLGAKRVLISGATGLVGSELSAFLTTGGHDVSSLTRHPKAATDIAWSPADGAVDTDRLAGFDAVVHLAGESIVGRWSEKKKRKIRESRVQGTRLLAESLARLADKPKVLVCASATGFYGDRGAEILTEESRPGAGFLPDVCVEWERACQPAQDAGIRIVNVRIGLVLTPKGGLLGTLLPLFKAGLAGRVGDGRQWMSWIAIDDLVDVFHAAIMDEAIAGPVNATAPNPVTNIEFTKTLGRVLHRPTLLPAPSFAVRAMLGEAGNALALSGARVLPARLRERGHAYRFEDLEPALRFLLGRTQRG
ncbi:MAG: TIGR01777 family oxidoreductase [Planctomycetota bacterium]|nr:TIGR01777 family protein [Planctomycetaceae bacterium]MDQ3332649.1 TIGR01777 family oxidoreductase [Planctomycetota bacterium]